MLDRFNKLISKAKNGYSNYSSSFKSLNNAYLLSYSDEKRKFLYGHKIAVWDVIAKCDIIGSSDSTIKNVVPNDIQIILDHAPIKRLYANGGKAYELYMRYCYPDCKREIIKLPSTSPANAAYSMEKLLAVWSDTILL